jgi:hypothetical protein
VDRAAISLARSVGGAAPDAVHFGEKIDSRLALDARAPAIFALSSSEAMKARAFSRFSHSKKSVRSLTFPALRKMRQLRSPFLCRQSKAESNDRFPGRIIGDFVVDKNVDHDSRVTPFNVTRCSK